ncbi:MAG: hypothetical protein JXA73_00540 [Acidobacteria bacterium]|nr:hypothetical protein [Acidobacteriota bacterium]
MFKLEMLPAGCGDCLLLLYGSKKKPHVVLIDGGVDDTAGIIRKRLERLRQSAVVERLPIELLVVTHIDNDHINGIIGLLKDGAPGLELKDIWFNGTSQLRRLKPNEPDDMLGGNAESDEFALTGESEPLPSDFLGPREGEELSGIIALNRWPWNKTFDGGLVGVRSAGTLPVKKIGNLTITILGPTRPRLDSLVTAWKNKLGDIGEIAGDMLGRLDTWPPEWKNGEGKDSSRTNGSSIALLVEHGNHSLLLSGDAYAKDMAASLDRLCNERGRKTIELSAFKLSHHGSINNISKDLMSRITCGRYLVSTDCSLPNAHPDQQAILRVLKHSTVTPCFCFNTAHDRTTVWSDKRMDVTGGGEYQDYDTEYPDDPSLGIVIDMES